MIHVSNSPVAAAQAELGTRANAGPRHLIEIDARLLIDHTL